MIADEFYKTKDLAPLMRHTVLTIDITSEGDNSAVPAVTNLLALIGQINDSLNGPAHLPEGTSVFVNGVKAAATWKIESR